MDKFELTDEDKKDLPKELIDALDDGSAVAIPVPQPTLSGRWVAILAAVVLGVALAPLFVEQVTLMMAVGNGLMAFGWFLAFCAMDRYATHIKFRLRVSSGISSGVMALMDRAIKEKETQTTESKEDLDGTSEDK